MQLRRNTKETAEVFTDSLNDIMFFLLLFFIIISTLVYPNIISINLPNSHSPTLSHSGKVIVQVDADHNYYVDNTKVTFDQLPAVLAAETKAKNTTSINLQVDKSLTVQDLADVLQVGSSLQLKMVLATKYAK